MIANALRVEIERYAAQMPRSNSLFLKAEDGTFAPAFMVTYLTNIKHLVSHTPIFLTRGRERARSIGDDRLAAHYEQKRADEFGHDVWAERDIERVSTISMTPSNTDIVPAMHELLGFLARTIDEDPTLYLSYVLFAEYLTVLLGPAWLKLLDERCGIPCSSVTVVGNHVDLDREHVQEALDEIDDLVADPSKLPRMRKVLLDSIAYFERFCAEVTADRTSESRIGANAAQHVSAA